MFGFDLEYYWKKAKETIAVATAAALLTVGAYDVGKKFVDNRPTLDVTRTLTYNIDGTWAHTRPSEHQVVMLPEEFCDYRLPVLPHEVIHNWQPGWSEGMVRRSAYNKQIADEATSHFKYNMRRA